MLSPPTVRSIGLDVKDVRPFVASGPSHCEDTGGKVLLPCERCGEATETRICTDCKAAELSNKPRKRSDKP